MRILTGYMPATDGKALVAGFDVFDQPIEAKRRTGYLPETPPLYPDMSVIEYLEFVAKIKGVPPNERSSRIKQVMQRTRIDDMASRQCAKLSKGYRQRVGLAQAILHNPEDRKSTRLNSSHLGISYAVFCLKKKIQLVAIVQFGQI